VGVSSQEPDWAAQLVDTFESAVGAVRSKTSEPATRVVKYAVFAVMALGTATLLFGLLIVGTVRMLDNYLPQGVWLAYFLLSALFMVLGAALWRKRK
jgi:vacuolar-type H+-ATPase subunit I/STV1